MENVLEQARAMHHQLGSLIAQWEQQLQQADDENKGDETKKNATKKPAVQPLSAADMGKGSLNECHSMVICNHSGFIGRKKESCSGRKKGQEGSGETTIDRFLFAG